MMPTPRYSVCMPGDPYPTELFSTGDLAEALKRRAWVGGLAVVYDWTTGQVVSEAPPGAAS